MEIGENFQLLSTYAFEMHLTEREKKKNILPNDILMSYFIAFVSFSLT